MKSLDFSPAVLAALGAAALFGASTPFAKLLVGGLSPFLLAGLLYLGSGIGLTLVRLFRDRGWKSPGLPMAEWPWLLGAIAAGGVAGPVLLMAGLAHTEAATASLLLNLEAVLTAVLAWVVFRENADRRIVLGMVLIVAGGALLAVPGAGQATAGLAGPALIAAACLAWAVDNNLTRKVSASDALFIAGIKGLVAGSVNLGVALFAGSTLPTVTVAAPAMLIGFLGYGVSLVLFVLALRGLGAARTGAYFSTAPFIGAATAILMLGDSTSLQFWLASGLMAAGVWLHLTERHEHEHTHEALEHRHRHVHDAHHQHEHDFEWDGTEPHTHPHRHIPVTHKHAHYPDIHHRHRHS
ncbi:DMT family transporter [Crenobacter cavernae]|uniref:DMT family transporter n=1 Tax=Crenobacter cavernae TaxID=2290923 RepID=A0ABY0FE72_9NEIS|nr:DMT family transporter [Crenobacter cavernae]RXZ44527.1 DMT family transporter [Crenobacter cavernae]